MSGKKDKPSFFSGLLHGIVQNLPLPAAGALLLLLGFVFDAPPMRYLAYSLFIAYPLCCSFQAVYGLSSKSILRAREQSPKSKAANEHGGEIESGAAMPNSTSSKSDDSSDAPDGASDTQESSAKPPDCER